MALEVTGLKRHWLEVVAWDDGPLTGRDRVSS